MVDIRTSYIVYDVKINTPSCNKEIKNITKLEYPQVNLLKLTKSDGSIVLIVLDLLHDPVIELNASGGLV